MGVRCGTTAGIQVAHERKTTATSHDFQHPATLSLSFSHPSFGVFDLFITKKRCPRAKKNIYIVFLQSVSLTHLLAWRTGPHAHTRCTRLAREPTRGTLSPVVALGPDCWTHNTQLTGQLTRWRYVVGFAGTDTGEKGGAQGRDTGLTH